jgi:F-type H+-transporting ATPase subunit epsilon
MAQIHCEIVTAERLVFEGDVDMVVAPGIEGQLGILPHHAPLMTALTFGELLLHRQDQEDEFIAIGGGFMEVVPDRVTILADSAERADEIDEERAEAALQRSLIRLKVAKRKSRRASRAPGPGTGQSSQ